MTAVPLPIQLYGTYRTCTDRPPSVQYSPSIMNSSGRDSESVSSRISSVRTTNELGRCKTSSDVSSPVPIHNEDEHISSSRVPSIPCVNRTSTKFSDPYDHSKPVHDSSRVPFLPRISGQNTQYKDSCDYKPTSYIDQDTCGPPRQQGGGPVPSQSFPKGLPIGPAQNNIPAGNATLVS